MKSTAWMRVMWLVGCVGALTPTAACDDDDVVAVTDTGATADSSTDVSTSTDGLTDADSSTPTDTGVVVDSTGTDGGGDATVAGPRARALLGATSDGGTVQGTVDFVESNGTVIATVNVAGATPGPHGMHIHENPSCDAVDGGPGLASGSHWNPTDASHGFPDAASHHVGDFGNIEVGANGTGTLTIVLSGLTVQPGPLSVVGRAVIFHAGPDDGVTQPTGNSGARPACGIVTAVP